MEALFKIASDSRYIEDFQYVPDLIDDVVGWFEDDLKQRRPVWTIRLNGEVIGLIEAGIRKSGRTSEPGYFIDVNHQGQGYATEALRLILDWTFENSEVHRIETSITASNVGSRRVVEKCGLKLEGTMRKNWPFKGEWHDSAMCSILREKWEGC